MSSVAEEQAARLAPFIAGEQPDERGEVSMYCPLHNDTRRSATANFEKGVWYCHAGCGGSSIRQLLLNDDAFVSVDGRVAAPKARKSGAGSTAMTDPAALSRQVRRWHRRLMNSDLALQKLADRRGIESGTARRARVGWDGRYFKIPVFGPERELWNVRTYDPSPRNGRRKI